MLYPTVLKTLVTLVYLHSTVYPTTYKECKLTDEK
jgi:hypothetical protein